MSRNRSGHLDIAAISSSPSNVRSLFCCSTFVDNDDNDDDLLVVRSDDAVVETSALLQTRGTPPPVTNLVVLVGNTENVDATMSATRKIK